MFAIRRSVLLTMCLVHFLADPLCAESPSVESVYPPAITIGKNSAVTVIGAGLERCAEVLFYDKDVHCSSFSVKSDEEILLNFEADPGAISGLRGFRVRTPQGLSELKTVLLVQQSIVQPIRSQDGAELTTVSVDSSVLSRVEPGATERFQVSLDARERIALEVEGVRLGLGLVDVALRVRDPRGAVIASVDDTLWYRQDPALSFETTVAGPHVIEVIDAGSERGSEGHYLLHISRTPRPVSVFPLGGPVGQGITLQFTGDTAGPFEQLHTLPQKPGTHWLVPSRDGRDALTRFPFRVAAMSNCFEQEPDEDSRADKVDLQPTIQQLPIAFNGRIQHSKDTDEFFLQVHAGEKIQLDVWAARLGSPLDSILRVWDSQNRPIATCDDRDSLDSQLTFTAEADDVVRVSIEDKRQQGGPDYCYRIESFIARPLVECFLPRRNRLSQDRNTIDVPQGNRVMALMGLRKDDSQGQVSLEPLQLPQGMSCVSRIPQIDEYVTVALFEASKAAPLAGSLVEVVATMSSSRAETAYGEFRQVVDLVNGPADTIYQEWCTNRLAVSVVEPVPFKISISKPETVLPRDGTLELQLSIERAQGFDGAVEIHVPWLPAWVDAILNLLFRKVSPQASCS